MNKNIKLLNLLSFIFRAMFMLLKEKGSRKKRYIEKKYPQLKL
jgi:hypothetical protein